MKKKQILVHDDEKDSMNLYADKLRGIDCVRKNFEVSPLMIDEFPHEMEVLIERQRVLRNKKKEYPNESKLDNADIFIVDFDLLKSIPNANWTSEMVAYLARCFSNCGLIIGLNLPTCHEFDLSLRGNPNSYADLNIVSKQLHNQGLWQDKKGQFRPWYWPPLLDYLDRFDQKIEEVKKHLEDPVCEVLGIENVIETFSQSVIEFIGGQRPLQTTFRQFVIDSQNGLRRKDKNPIVESMCRIAAARISKWLERRVLSGQNILIDAPHLVARFPTLLDGDESGIEALDKTAAFLPYNRLGLRHLIIERFRFKKSHWLSRPVWFWRKLSDFEGIEEVSKPWQKQPSKYVFCEDASRFYRKTACKQFTADVDSPYNRRYVKLFSKVDYEPRVRLLV